MQYKKLTLLHPALPLIVMLLATACGNEDSHGASDLPVEKNQARVTTDEPVKGDSPPITTGITIANQRYFFDVTNHTVEELQALLERIEAITEASPETFDELEIVMVLHGPDIGLFTRSNYEQNQRLVNLAAKLDAFKVVDMKACETAMDKLGYTRTEIPPFIETVPYAPDEIKRLQSEGYVNL